VSPFVALQDPRDAGAWADLAALVGPDQEVPVAGGAELAPDGWSRGWTIPGVQMVGTDRLVGVADDESVVLGPDDVPDMLALTDRTRPGPFAPETYLMGTYRGIRRGGRLVAMAGERLRPGGATEVSAVCTDEEVRGQGLASRLVLAVAHGIQARGQLPILHAATSNEGAIRLYRSLGFEVRRHVMFAGVRTPGQVQA
jgi:ribosomal protein S18 acetylase RimI-like enzyme